MKLHYDSKMLQAEILKDPIRILRLFYYRNEEFENIL